jgi:SAM-dependent methyltransferase
MHNKAFVDSEWEGWARNAAHYDVMDLPATRQAIAPLLDRVGPLHGRCVLEVACGTGHLAEHAMARGATVVGIDVAAPRVALARQRVPGATFHEGNAEALPFDNAHFDVVLCCFGLLHFRQPAQALREAARVLKPGGVCAFTVWYGPEQGNVFFGLILGTSQAQAPMEIGLPPALPMFALADPAVHDPMLRQAGFADIQTQDLPIVWPLHGPETTFACVLKGAVRPRLRYERQTPQVQQRMHQALIVGTEPYVGDTTAGIPCPAVLVTARKTS